MANKKYNKEDLEILIATMNRNDLSFLEKMFQKPVADIKENLLIVNQSINYQITSDFTNIKVINSREIGLSKSRNLAIEKSTKELCWILDDDCIVLPDATEHIIKAHNQVSNAILTFQTKTVVTNDLYYNYLPNSQPHSNQSLLYVLSPEITFKRKYLLKINLNFDERFGLGAQFQDSENYVFLKEAICKGIAPYFYKSSIVKHEQINSSQEFFEDRVIYARGAVAAFQNQNITFRKWKYGIFLIKKNAISSISQLLDKMTTFKKGAVDYLQSIKN